jgi:hypothetical protein
LLGGEFRGDGGGPIRECEENLFRLEIAGVEVGVAKTGEDLVDGIPGDPRTIEAVPFDFVDLARGDFVPDFRTELGFAVNESIAVLLLAARQFGDDEVRALFEARVTGGGIGEGDRGEVVAEGMARDILLFPPAVARGVDRESGLLVEGGEEAIGGELEEDFVVLREGLEQRAIEEADAGEGDGARGQREGSGLG